MRKKERKARPPSIKGEGSLLHREGKKGAPPTGSSPIKGKGNLLGSRKKKRVGKEETTYFRKEGPEGPRPTTFYLRKKPTPGHHGERTAMNTRNSKKGVSAQEGKPVEEQSQRKVSSKVANSPKKKPSDAAGRKRGKQSTLTGLQ